MYSKRFAIVRHFVSNRSERGARAEERVRGNKLYVLQKSGEKSFCCS